MNDLTDQQLLRDYTERQSEAAFGELVRRYVDLVYSAALRMVCEAHAAKDVTQAVFVLLAQEARQLTDRPALAGWLHCTARNLAAKTVRSDVRRRAREQEAALMNELLSANPEADWKHIAPQLDEALGELSEPDREALLLRYFKNHDLRTVGATLGISDDAAQKRVSRAVERLREFFAKRGVTVGASGLAVVISANAVQAAPVGLALTISTAAALTGTTLATTATATVTKAIAMTALQKTIITATIAVLAGAGIYEARQAAQFRVQAQTLRQQQGPWAEQIQRLQNGFAEATNQLADLAAENARMKFKPNETELVRLRGEVTRLRAQAQASPTEQAAKAWARRVELLKQYAQQKPEKSIPEMKYLTQDDWLAAAREADSESDNGMRKALQTARTTAKGKVADIFSTALRAYLNSNGPRFPSTIEDLKPYFESPVDDTILSRYAIVPSRDVTNVGQGGEWVIAEIGPADPGYDTRFVVGEQRNGQTDFDADLIMPLVKAFTASGQKLNDPSQLLPLAKTAEQRRVVEAWIQRFPNLQKGLAEPHTTIQMEGWK